VGTLRFGLQGRGDRRESAERLHYRKDGEMSCASLVYLRITDLELGFDFFFFFRHRFYEIT